MDVVHFATRVNKPTVLTYHSDIVRQKYLLQLYRPLKNRFLADMDKIGASSPNYFATSDVLAKYADKVDVIPIGVDMESYPKPEPDRLRYWHERFGPKFFYLLA